MAADDCSKGGAPISTVRSVLNPPNLLSLFRILLVPLLVAILLTKFEGKPIVGLGVFWLASLTDFLDGFIARRRKMVTRLGKLLDPAADKILTSAAFIALVELNLAPAWMVVAILAREFAVSSLRSLVASENLVLGAIFSAKVKTVCQIVSISLLIFYSQPGWWSTRLGQFEPLASLSLWVAMLASLYSGVEYFIRFGPLVVQGRSNEES